MPLLARECGEAAQRIIDSGGGDPLTELQRRWYSIYCREAPLLPLWGESAAELGVAPERLMDEVRLLRDGTS